MVARADGEARGLDEGAEVLDFRQLRAELGDALITDRIESNDSARSSAVRTRSAMCSVSSPSLDDDGLSSGGGHGRLNPRPVADPGDGVTMEGLMLLARMIILGIALALFGGLVAGARSADAPAPAQSVTCDRIVLHARSGAEDGFRILLESVSFPGADHLAKDTSRVPGRWPYYRNAGLAIRAGTTAVSVSVPEGWRDRLALSWGGVRRSSTIRFAPCAAAAAGTWNAFSGGLHLRTPGDCVPLLVTVGGLSTTVRVGVGRACGTSH